MSSKKRGCDYERKLIELLYLKGYSAVRVAGSGCSKNPSPDIIASNGSRIIAFEVKSVQSDKIYLAKEVVDKLLSFSRSFNCEAWFAVHLLRKGWFFKRADELVDLIINESNSLKSF